MNMTLQDPATGETMFRYYYVNLPADYDETKEYPIIMWFHGWGSVTRPTNSNFEQLGQKEGIITVYPIGMGDELGEAARNSWNVGDAGNTFTCTENTVSSCYVSCKKLNQCSRCNCFTCYDDAFFVKSLFYELEWYFCINENKRYVTGASNGGMFTYYLASQIPEVITGGYGPVCGQPMVGWINTPEQAAQKMMIGFFGRSDGIIPPKGGVDKDGMWIYESLDETYWVWGLQQGCDLDSWRVVATPYDNEANNKNLQCWEFTKGCQTGRAMKCMHDGGHCAYP